MTRRGAEHALAFNTAAARATRLSHAAATEVRLITERLVVFSPTRRSCTRWRRAVIFSKSFLWAAR